MASEDTLGTPIASREDALNVVPEAPEPNSTNDQANAPSSADTMPNESSPNEDTEPELELPAEPESSWAPATAPAPNAQTEPNAPPPETTDAPSLSSMDHTASEDIARVDPNSDLFSLPGAGAGMVWMFHQCGIRSLEDLAQANADDLASRLGVVGHIINMEPWIAFAREVEQRAS
ncbi:MAG: hypothetical protein AAGA06_00220 [Pseudomonadota bacterium]